VHGSRTGQIAMGGYLGRFKNGFGTGTSVQAFEFSSEGRE